jgi:hypothetical protein
VREIPGPRKVTAENCINCLDETRVVMLIVLRRKWAMYSGMIWSGRSSDRRITTGLTPCLRHVSGKLVFEELIG